jgi:hypothetical protein
MPPDTIAMTELRAANTLNTLSSINATYRYPNLQYGNAKNMNIIRAQSPKHLTLHNNDTGSKGLRQVWMQDCCCLKPASYSTGISL